MLDTAKQLEYAPSSLRTIVCRVLHTRPDPGNWSEYPNIWSEVQELVYGCDWFRIYDLIEALYATFARHDGSNGLHDASTFAKQLNEFFIDEGIGWRLLTARS